MNKELNVFKNRILAYDQRIGKLEKTLKKAVIVIVLLACTVILSFVYIGLSA